MNTTLYVSATRGPQIYSDAKILAARHGVSLSILVETLLDLATDRRPVFNSIVTSALAKAKKQTYTRRNGAVVSRRATTKVSRQR